MKLILNKKVIFHGLSFAKNVFNICLFIKWVFVIDVDVQFHSNKHESGNNV